MKYTITLTEQLHAQLQGHLFSSQNEAAAYILCRRSVTENETRLLCKRIIPVEADGIIDASSTQMSIKQASFLAAIKAADREKCSFVFVHSHPDQTASHSAQDDEEERSLFRTAYVRINGGGPHGSIVATKSGSLVGRIWLEDGSTCPITTFRVVGNKFRFIHSGSLEIPTALYNRQIRAFGPDLQGVLAKLNAGVVGAGGTGSSVAEQLIRLGVGTLTVVDGGKLEASNVTRGYGSSLADEGTAKPEIIKRLADRLGLNTVVKAITKDCSYLSTMQALKDCDVIFGCTDDQWGRSLLNRLAVYYLIPVFDMGVKFDTENEKLLSIQGRVTTLLPGMACLFCRGRISAGGVREESLSALDPKEAAGLRREGYIPALEAPAASMIPFTTSVATWAVIEFLHRLTMLGGPERTATETLHFFDQTRLRTNSTAPNPEPCICNDAQKTARGDCAPLLDCTWRPE